MTNQVFTPHDRRQHFLPALVVLFVALTALGLLSDELEGRHQLNLQDHFKYEANRITTKIGERMSANGQLLRGAAGLFAASGHVTRAQWRAYVEKLELDQVYRGILGVGFSIYIPRERLQSHVAAVRAEGFPEYLIKPQGERSAFSSIIYLEPFSGRNLRAFGFDMLSEPVRRAAMEGSRDSGSLAYSGKVELVQETKVDVQAGILAYYPVYENGRVLQTVEQRRKAFIGWVYSPYRMNDLIGAILQHEETEAIRLEIFDGTTTDSAAILYDSHANDLHRDEPPLFSQVAQLPLEGRTWTLRYSALPAFARVTKFEPPWVEIAAIAIIGALLFAITWSLVNTRRRAEELAAQLTASLSESEARYRSLFTGAKVVMLIIDPEDGSIVEANEAACHYYGYDEDAIKRLKISDINTLSPLQVSEEMWRAVQERRNHFYFQHRLANGDLRDVEVHSGPIRVAGRSLLYSLVHDITDRRRIERERRRLVQAVEQSPASIIIADTSGNLEYVNPAFCRVTGYSPAEVMGQNPRILKSGATSAEEYRAMWETLTAGRPWQGLFRNRKKSGELYWESAQISPVFDEQGRITHYLGVKEDITERKLAEEEIRALNRQLQNLLSAASEVAIIATDEQGIITLFNSGAERMLGYSAGEVVGRETPMLFHLSEEVIERQRSVAPGHEVGAEGFPVDDEGHAERRDIGEWTFVRKNGSQLQVSLVRTPLLDDDGKPAGYLGIAQDITERKRIEGELQASERRFRSTFEQAAVGIAHISAEGRFLRVNDRYCAITGYPRKELEARTYHEITHPADLEGEIALVREVLDQRRDSITIQKRYLRKDGKTVWAQLTLSALRDEEGRFRHFIAVLEDINERKEMETRLMESEERYRSVVEQVKEVIFQTDTEGLWTFLNPAWSDVTGFSVEESLGRPLRDYIHPDDRERNDALFRPVLQREREFCRHEIRYLHREGGFRWVEVYARLILAADGRRLGISGTLADISARRNAEELLRQRDRYQRALLDNFPFLVWLKDTESRFLAVNEPFARAFGHASAEEVEGLADREVWPGDLAERSRVDDRSVLESGRQQHVEEVVQADGRPVWYEIYKTPVLDSDGSLLGIVGFARDVTDRKQADERLRLAAGVFEEANEGIMITDVDANIVDVNRAFTQLTGYDRSEVIGRNPRLLQSGHQDGAFYKAMWQTLLEAGHWSGEIWNRRREGEIFAEAITISAIRDGSGNITHYIGLFSDITERKRQQATIEHLAYYDALTQLPNRILLGDRIRQALARAQRQETLVAVCYLDLDGFKPINDRYGHQTGDRVLVEVAKRMLASVRAQDTVARLGGDEFVLLLTDIIAPEESDAILARVLDSISAPIMLGNGNATSVSASVGLTIYPMDGSDADTLLRHADQAMYGAKQEGRNCIRIFDADQDQRARDHRETRERIRQGLREEQFVLYWQPKVDMRAGKVVGAEALIRWRLPDGNMVMPAHFLPLIEEDLLIVDLGDWVLRRAWDTAERWREAGLQLVISVNVAAKQLVEPDFISKLEAELMRHPQLSPTQLELEILESAALKDLARIQEVIEACRRLGVSFALDDFGTGYSSMTHFRRLPTETVKIDQSFVRDMLDDEADLSIVDGILGMTRAFGKRAIAEGVEYREHGIVLLHMGCPVGQGYSLGRPMAEADFEQWLKAFKGDPAWSRGLSEWELADYPLVTAQIEHDRTLGELIAFADGARAPSYIHSGSTCRLERWLAKRGKRWEGLASHARLVERHARLKTHLMRGCEQVRQGETAGALASIDEAKAALALLDEAAMALLGEMTSRAAPPAAPLHEDSLLSGE